MKTSAPLTKVQFGLYVECNAHQGEACYNLPYLYVLDGTLDEERLRKAIEVAVAAHPTLFTRMELNDDGDPLQTIDDGETFELTVEHVNDIEAEKQHMIVPFDIYKDRLFHIRLLKDDKHFYFFLDIHHIIGDGTTLKVMLADLEKAYNGEALEPESLTMAEVAIAEAELRKTSAFDEGKQWFAENFDCGDCFTQLTPDLEEPEHTENSMVRTLSVDMERVDAFCKGNGIFKSNFFTTAYSFLLAKYNNEQESLFTTIYNGRSDKRFLHSVGMTVKTLPVYAKFDNEKKVLDYLKAGQDQMSGVRKHEAYAFSDAVNDLGIQSNSMFAWHGTMFADEKLCGKPMKTIRLCNSTLEASLYLKAFIQNGKYQVKAEYNSNEYSEDIISQYLESYEAVVEGFLTREYLRDINITTEAQTEVLDSFNQNDVDYDNTQTIVSLFRHQVEQTPDNIAVVYQDKRFTYKEVDEMSDRLAVYIASQGLGSEDVVSVLIPRCEWMAIASLGVLKAGCAYQPLDPTYPKERLNFMMQDANAKMLISLNPVSSPKGEGSDGLASDWLSGLDHIKEANISVFDLLDFDSLPKVTTPLSLGEGPRGEAPTPSSLFILLYTSGSTGVPKGCQLTHANLVCFCHWYQRYYRLSAENKVAAYASYGFDACMMDMYPALTCGATLHIIPEEIRLDLIALNDYFEREQITHSFMTTQVGYQFATSIENKSLHYLSTGGEKLASLTPPKGLRFVNVYGPTETTVLVTFYEVEKKKKEIPIGRAIDNMRLYVVDPQGHRLPVGAAGELWISGPQVSRGYLNRPEKTAEVFIPNPFTTDNKYARIYRTGDIVRYLPDGNIQFVGRRDGQVKIRGFRIELKEVEAIIREFPGIKDATVQAFDEDGGGKFITAYVVSDQQVDIEALNNFILDQKPPYMVPAVTMQLDAIPLNQNQKVNKRALPKPVKSVATLSQQIEHAPMNVLEQELHDMIAAIVNNEDFGITTILGYAGLTSISAIKLAVQVNKRYGVALDSKTLVKTGTLQSIENEVLARLLSPQGESDTATKPDATVVGREQTFPLSYAQMGVYVECIKNPTSTIYNIPTKVAFPLSTDQQALENALRKLVAEHPQMTVHFGSEGSETVQITEPQQAVEVVHTSLSEAELESYQREFVRPFNLNKGPLYRFEIVTTELMCYLLIDVHHLLFDGASLDIVLNELCTLLDGAAIDNEDQTYAAFVMEEKKAEEGEDFAAASAWFQERLGTCEGVTEIPADLTNPIEQGVINVATAPIDIDAVSAFCRSHNMTPAHLTLAAVFYTLSRFANSERLCITTISNGRSNLRIRNTVGMFVNTLALSAYIGEQTVMNFLQEVSETFDKTLEHENYPFAKVAADYDLSAEIMFAYQLGVINRYTCQGVQLKTETLELNVPKFRVAFYIKEYQGKPCVYVEYDNGRYSQGLMQSLADSVSLAVAAFIREPEVSLPSVSLLDARQMSLLDSFNVTDVDYDDSQNIVSLFRRQVEQTPDNLAVVYHDVHLTYKQVDEQSERIAAYIQSLGLGAEDVVSVLIPRCEWMAVASLGVLKAGCAYQPLDPSYPAERLNFMMQDANAKLLIADEELRPIVDEYKGDVLLTKDIMNLPVITAEANTSLLTLNSSLKPSSLFILLYTSGSTGTPKGCQLTHGNLVTFCHWYQRYYDLQPGDKVAAYASYGFDACMMDMYPALTCGATVYIIGEDIRLNLPDLNDYFNHEGITHSFMTTQVGCQFAMNCDNHSLRHLSVGGEKVLPLTPPTNYQLHNGYGPTECTIFTTTYPMTEFEQNAPIGKPLDNMRLYVVDKQFNRLPLGAVGELWVSGPQVSRGYLNRPEKTAEVFIPNPFTPDKKYARCYRTGDIVRYLPDGNIQFVGRRDGQVKIRGFRIELKEVEAVIRQYQDIKDATVQAFDYENGGKYIAAYIVSDQQIDIKDLNAFIAQQKPPYMVPAATMQIDAIPLNQNQKVNRKALPAPVIQASDREYVEPKNEQERLFAKIFGDILSMEKVSALDNFFDLGGTSLMVTRVVIEADKAGLHVAYGDVFANPTPRQLARFVSGDTSDGDDSSTADEVSGFDYSAINDLLQKNTLTTFLQGARQSLGNVMITGATGYLGIHVLRELIDSDADKIYCMVRGESQEAAESRLRTLLFYYFSDAFKSLFGSRLFVVRGDVTSFDELPGIHIDTVFNCAANVKHFSKGTDIEDVNIGGAQNCVNFCLKTGARLIHVSTTSVGGLSVNGVPAPDVMLTEQSLYFGQYLGNQYTYSKFMADRVILDAVASHGLNAKIMRVGNLAARSTDGEFQVNFQSNSYMGRIKVYNMLGCCPYTMYDAPAEFSPINETAHAIVLLAATPRECTVFHPYNNHLQLMGDILTQLGNITGGVRFVEPEEFESVMEEAKNDPQKAKQLSSMLAYKDMAHGQKSANVGRQNSYTSQVLHRLGFYWSPTSWDYDQQMLTAIAGFGFFD